MSDHNSNSDDAPEELTQEQAKIQDAAFRKIQRENTARVAREKKEKRKYKAEKLTPRKSKKKVETFEDKEEEEEEEEDEEEDSASLLKKGFLPDYIVNSLAEGEKKKVWSDSEGEEEEEVKEEVVPIKKKQKSSGIKTVLYKDIPPPQCSKSAADFLNKRKAQVSRSSSVLKKSGAASFNKQK